MIPGRLFSLVLVQSISALLVQATLYITKPLPGSSCSGGQECVVEWLDDGVVPLLNQIGPCYVALYNGDVKLIQQIEPVNVGSQHSLTFTPDPNAGPNSSGYYINFTSVQAVQGGVYHQFSTMFSIDNMSGSFSSPVESDTAAIPVPPTLLSSTSATPTSTVSLPAPSSSGTQSPVASNTSASGTQVSASSSQSASSGSSSSSVSSGPDSSSTQSSTSNAPSTTNGSPPAFTAQTTLTVAAPTTFKPFGGSSTAPAAPESSNTATTVNQPSSGSRVAAVPFLLSSAVVLAFGLLM